MILEIKILLVFKRSIKVLQHLMFRILFRKISMFRRNAPIDTKRFIQYRDTPVSSTATCLPYVGDPLRNLLLFQHKVVLLHA